VAVMADRYYHVDVVGKYDFVKRDDSIAAVRAWAKKAFPRMAVRVSAQRYRFCGDCQCSPCCCMVRSDA
jgi:hypothetical protein